VYEGRPVVQASGSIELWHRQCWALRDVALGPEGPIRQWTPPVPYRAIRFAATSIAVMALAGLGFAQWQMNETHPLPAAALAQVQLGSSEDVATSVKLGGAQHESIPERVATVETQLESRYAVPQLESGLALDEQFPSLRGWTHPVTNSPELMPEQASRHFGSARIGIERPECGAGHCGVDLDGPRGRPIVAVAVGTVVRIEHSELGLDGKSGRYVKIEHDDGALTAYMHLDSIEDGLRVGQRIAAGQVVGTLGATATYVAPPHCHFSLEVPNHPGTHGDNTDTHYVDPAPFLVRATIAPDPRHDHPLF
jgi:murein DD-endopeptidase MepM/ murein hydrolase activator NlpD